MALRGEMLFLEVPISTVESGSLATVVQVAFKNYINLTMLELEESYWAEVALKKDSPVSTVTTPYKIKYIYSGGKQNYQYIHFWKNSI